MTRTSTEQPEALMRLADNYAEACFDQGLNQRTTDDKPETEREKLEKAIRRQHARIAELEDAADMAIKRIAELEAQLSAIGACGVEPLRKQAVRRAPAAPVPQWVRPVSELLGHISDVLPNSAFNKIDTAKWNAVSALVGATTQAADAKDAARYRWLRDNDLYADKELGPVIRLQLKAIWDVKSTKP